MNFGPFLFFLCAATAFASSARADILFIDLNYSYKEVIAAEQAAAARGEALLTIPNIPAEQRKTLSAIKSQLDAAEFSQRKAAEANQAFRKKGGSPDSPRGKALQQALTESSQSVEQHRAQFHRTSAPFRMGLDIIKKVISANSKRNPGITSIVISGHYSSGHVHGYLGEFEEEELIEHLASKNGRLPYLRSIYLWGCYAATIKNIKMWRSAVPTLQLFGGFDDRGPLGARPVSAQLLSSLLIQEKRITTQTSPGAVKSTDPLTEQKNLEAAFRSLSGTKDTHAAICVGNIYVNRDGAMPLTGTARCSAEIYEQVRSGRELFRKFLSAAPGFEDVPENTSNSALRAYYRLLKQYAHCTKIAEIAQEDTHRIIRLIFYKTLTKNYSLYAESRLADLREILRKMGNPVKLPDFADPKITRAAILEASKKLNALYHQCSNPTVTQRIRVLYDDGEKRQSELRGEFLKKEQGTVREIHKLLNALECLPPDWIEPASSGQQLMRPSFSCLA